MELRELGSQGATVGVVVLQTNPRINQWHIGVVYASATGGRQMLDHGWERRLTNQPLTAILNNYNGAIIGVELAEYDAWAFAVLCEQIVSKSPRGFRYEFPERGERLDGGVQANDNGFTCATFVLAVFRTAANLELLALDQWPDPDERDRNWQRAITNKLLEDLSQGQDFERERERRTAMIPCKQVRPTDVAAAACCAPETWPVASSCARFIAGELARFIAP